MFTGKSILVTGGTGSFGRTFVRTVLRDYRPKRVVVFSRDELKQYEMEKDLGAPEMRYFIGDVRDLPRINLAMRGVDYVVHAAALKQVPAAEYNPIECIKTNILGAQNVVMAALENNVEKVVALSSDKAANPVNLYGASKLASDKLFVAANNMVGRHRTRFSVVRYGNVVGSRGSVVPYFQKLMSEGASELPVTDPRMTRFVITLDQGVSFVVKSFQRMQGGEIFVPKMPSMRIMDLVKSFSRPVRHRVIGIRPGEKLHEMICPSDDSHLTIDFLDHYVIRPGITFNEPIDFSVNKSGEQGHPVGDAFEYCSGTNRHFLTVDEIRGIHSPGRSARHAVAD